MRLCTLCARGGSRGVANKNLRVLHGRPLLDYSIEHARQCGLFEIVAVSSDSTDILEAARQAGADIMIQRPDELASDEAAKLPAIQHAARWVEAQTGLQFQTFVDLDATSPLRLPSDIVGAVALLEDGGYANVLTGTPARRSPYFNLVEQGEDGAVRLSKTLDHTIVRRQDAPPCFDLNASIYVWQRDAFFGPNPMLSPGTRLFEMPEERSFDIDSELDWRIVEMIMRA